MFTQPERRALLFLFGTAALGVGVRAVRAGASGPPGASLVAADLSAGNLAAQESSAQHALLAARPLEPGQTVDVDHADAVEIERLPRIGPQLARRIVDERTAHGLFGSLAGLRRVRGVGPAVLEALKRQATFSGVPAGDANDLGADPVSLQGPTQSPSASRARLQGRAAPRGLSQRLEPGIATTPAPPPPPPTGVTVVVSRTRRTRAARAPVRLVQCPAMPLSINDASAEQLTCLPGIGPGLATRIVTWRTAHGPFAEVKDLEHVPGIGAGRLQQLIPYVRAP